MNVLLIGSGGREHAIAWKILQSPRVKKLYLTTTNASPIFLKQEFKNTEIITAAISETDISQFVNFASNNKIDLVIIGPEIPLAAGVSDALNKAGIAVFGPSQAAAQIETSKAFAKDFMARHNIPTARHAVFKNFATAINNVQKIHYPIVIKASGLAAGKGVFLPDSPSEIEEILRQIMVEHSLGSAGNEVIIEERLQGEEVSLLAFSDGVTVKAMPTARDHKRLLENNEGPNTGGMGVYAPVPGYSSADIDHWTATILQPTIDGLRAENKPFVGVLYAGLMLTAQGPRVLEFNCRFGDPETQVLLPLLDSDLIYIMEACVEQRLAQREIKWKNQSAVCVVLAAEGYPDQPKKGDVINGLENKTLIFHAGTKQQDNHIITAGGRVLGITALGDTLEHARTQAYQTVEKISFAGMHFRKDIAFNYSD
jgi:phosphoribosylamine--glycine ligase